MKCSTCANRWPNNMCRSMMRKPKARWCYMTAEEAVNAERAVITYIEQQEETLESEEELKKLRMIKTKAHSRITELEG
ncbi:hypothetical protein FRZ06_10185 [Anoxybacterium hadale]|uniref:Uncharacterized protein n=1 Tax=Anoxybacterium hadale TaxID=3408580 RepID=A0ACD1ABK2_9FIRM|nr:hypothetical protein FRZ06_10185 [Clostridiales bacterium]